MPVLKRILVATDLSAAGQRAVMRAGQLARQWEANLFLVHARPDWNLFSRWRPASQESYQEVATSADESAILGRIESLAPNLVVIGRREPQAAHLQPGPMGGVGFRIAYHAPTDVLMLSS